MMIRLTACLALACLVAEASHCSAQDSELQTTTATAPSPNSIAGDRPVRQATSEEIDDAIRTRDYKPVLKEELFNSKLPNKLDLKHSNSNDIIKASYKAVLDNTDRLNGDIRLELSESRSTRRRLGHTNLQDLQFIKNQQKLTLGQTVKHETVVLVPEGVTAIDGYWTRKGRQQSGTLIFELQLPLAVMHEFELLAPREVNVTSTNSLVHNAGPVEDSELENNRWILYPSGNGRLTINCSRQVVSTTSDRSFSSSADYSVRLDDCQVRWNLNLPSIPQQSEFSLQFSSEFTPRFVLGPGQRSLPFVWEPETHKLTVTNANVTTLTALVISGAFPKPIATGCRLPILTGGHWTDRTLQTSGDLRLSSGMLRANFSAELSLQRSNLTGLMETDVEFAADGSQRLTIEQFQGRASAHFSLMVPDPVIQEDVVTRRTGEPGQIEVLVRVENRSGVADTLQYDIPKKYRVTAVRELETQLPLLFRTLPAESSTATQPIKIYLRTPMARDSRQLIQIQLQSTSNDVNLQEAQLTNSDYLRLSDVLAVSGDQIPAELSQTGASVDLELKAAYPWLPEDTREAVLFHRSQSPPSIQTSFESNEITAAISHSVAVDKRVIREVIQINFSGSPGLPREVTIQAADTAELRLKATDFQLGFRLVRRTNRTLTSDWVLTFPDDASKTDLSVTLECERPAASQNSPMLVHVLEATQRFATISLIPPTDFWDLLDEDGQPVAGTITYPDRPLDAKLRIQFNDSNQESRQVHGMATWLLEQDEEQVRATALFQLSTFGVSKRLSLSLDLPVSQRCLCIVNDHQLDVAIQDGDVDILLPESQSQTSIELLVSGISIPTDAQTEFRIPHLNIANEVDQNIGTTVVPPSGQTLTVVDETNATRLRKVRAGLTSELVQTTSSASGIQHFFARLAMRQKNVDSLFLSSASPSKSFELQLGQSNAPLIRSVLIALALVLIVAVLTPGGAISWTVTGLGILSAQIIGIIYPEPIYLSPILTLAFATAGLLTYLLRHASITSPSRSQPTSDEPKSVSVFGRLLAGLVIAGLAQSAYGQEDILIPNDDSPIIFVPPTLIPALPDRNPDSTDSVLVLDSEVELRLLDKKSVSATLTCRIAVDPAVDHLFELPVNDVTLIDCKLDRHTILPVKSKTEKPAILIDATPQPGPLLDRSLPIVASTAPHWVAGLKVHEIRYTIRVIARPDVLGVRAVIPLPAAPITQLTVLDSTESVAEVGLLVPEPISGVRLGNQFDFPTLSSVSEVELKMQFSTSAIDRRQRPQSSEIVASVLASPSLLKITSRCELSPVDPKSEAVRIARMPKMTLVRVQSEDGNSITPIVEQDYIEIPIKADRQGLQKFQCEWQQSLPLTSNITIDVKPLRQLNRISSDRLVLVAGTSDRFTIDSVRSDKTRLEPMSESEAQVPSPLKDTEAAYLIPEQIDAVVVQLVRPLDTREAGLKQQALVRDNDIQWTCACALQIPDEPIFRQHFTVSQDLKIQSVSARSPEIDRLQSWYRDGDQVVICLREATRGSLTLTIDGILPRATKSDTPLPVVTLPDSVEVLESSLEISAAKPNDIFVRSLGGASPDSQFDLETVAVPTTPIRFTVTDEQRPVIIRPAPQRAAQANLVALISNSDNQTQMTIFIALQAVESPFDMPLATPTNVAYATSRVFALPAEGSVSELTNPQQSIPITAKGSIDDNDLSVVVYTGIVPAMTSDVISLPLPELGNPCTIESLSVLDGRERNGITAVPRWIRNILPDLPDATSPGNVNSLPVTLNETENLINIRLPSSPSGTEQEALENRPAYAVTTHRLNGDTDSVQGSTGILAFAPAANAAVTIVLPDECNLLQVRQNGMLSPFTFTSQTEIAVTLTTRICFLELEWLQPVPTNNALRSARLNLPTLDNVEGRILIDPTLPSSDWRPKERSTERVDFPALLTEITSGIQLIGASTTLSNSTTPGTETQQLAPLTENPVWAEFESQSGKAAKACVEFFADLSQEENELSLVAFDTTKPTIEIRRKLSLNTVLALLAAACMLVVGLSTQSAQNRRATKAKQQRQTEKQPETAEQPLADAGHDQETSP